jgi:predicted transcriptional regulator
MGDLEQQKAAKKERGQSWKEQDNNMEGNSNRVLSFIQKNPGCHLRQIKRELQMSIGTTQYHLDRLLKMGKISSTKNDFYKYYFPIGIFDQDQKYLLEMLQQETTREILMIIIEQKNPIQTDIVNRIGISAAAVNWHIRRLVDSKVIDEVRDGKYKRYRLCADPVCILALLRRYYPSIWEKWSIRLIELFLSLSKNSDGDK